MNFRSLLLTLTAAAIAAIAVLNWNTLAASVPVSLGVVTVDAPLGIVMLALTALLAAFALAYVLWLQGSVLMETRRHGQEMQVQRELADKAERARSKGLPMSEMSGGCFSISSLGNLGGTGFTPIINAPELAILGVTRSAERLKLVDGQVSSVPVVPLSLSYDHRVINGADAARFTRFIADALADPAALA